MQRKMMNAANAAATLTFHGDIDVRDSLRPVNDPSLRCAKDE
jgi:hypothetical protein